MDRHTRRGRRLHRWAAVVAFVLLVPVLLTARGDEPAADASLDAMRARAAQTQIVLVDDQGSALRSAELAPQPVFRYSDEVRRISDSTLWVWTDGGRPVALQKVEFLDQDPAKPLWTHCFASLATGLLRVDWAGGHRYETKAPGLAFTTLADGPPPAATRGARLQQLRRLARQFSATLNNDPKHNSREQMRLLPRPILEYEAPDQGLVVGAVFGFAFGTNPDALLVLELAADDGSPPAWRYAATRMTTGGVEMRLKDHPFFTAEWVHPTPTAFETWTFFFEPREE